MPAQFDSFGVRFLYPDNWTVADREDADGDQGTTLDLPGGGFVSIELISADAVDDLIDGIVSAISADYDDLEREEVTLEVLPTNTPVTDLRFYYLDLIVISRLVVLPVESKLAGADVSEESGGDVLVVQMQAEIRDFDKNEAVFDAVLKQIVEAT